LMDAGSNFHSATALENLCAAGIRSIDVQGFQASTPARVVPHLWVQNSLLEVV
jgi:hypothetical protein